MKQFRVCLLTPGHIASDPRLVKEADALHAAGYDVRVVAGDSTAAVRPLDRALLDQAPWRFSLVGFGSGVAYRTRRLIQSGARQCVRGGIRAPSVCTWAHSPISARLATVASREYADLYIGHCLAALPAAAQAAQRHGTAYGFDAEDDHVGELDPEQQLGPEGQARNELLRAYLPGCAHLTASSPLISQALRERYGVVSTTVLNVFPLSEAPCELTPSGRKTGEPLSLYWFSQTIGPGRGLEQLADAISVTSSSLYLNLRGAPVRGFIDELRRRAGTRSDAIRALPSAPPKDMASLSAGHDIGLSVELDEPVNRDRCLTNKIFAYLLAGIPVLMSRTSAQDRIARELGKAAWCVDIHDREATATLLDRLSVESTEVAEARACSWELGRTRFNWDGEKDLFLSSVRRVLNEADDTDRSR